jgi:FO synthase
VTEPAAEPTVSAIRRAVRRARDGVALDPTEAAVLMAARDERLEDLLAAAARVRDAGLAAAGRPGVVTYSRKVFVPLTRLCRDRCHYCTFATTPGRLAAPFLERSEVLDIARRGASLGCKEALFTLGDRPESRWPAAREWLTQRGYDSTLDYLRACAVAVLEETGLLPHLNPGVLSWADLQRLKPVAPSMGMMLETTATRLFSEPGGAHYGSPDKDPAVRLRVLEDAGRVGVPFTTGILVGIGETRLERAESLFAIRRVAREYGAVQEVIVQNFRSKPDTAMRSVPDVPIDEFVATVAVARLVLGPGMRLQAPPNLVDLAECGQLLRAGIDDWGGVSPVTPDHVNPERPWPDIDLLAAASEEAGFALRERLTAYPPYVLAGQPWLDPRVLAHVRALADPETGLAGTDAVPNGRPWQEPDGGWAATGRVDLHATIDTTGRTADRRADFDEVYGDWASVADRIPADARRAGPPSPATPAETTETATPAGATPTVAVSATADAPPPATAEPALASPAELTPTAAGLTAPARERVDAQVRAALRHAEADPAGICDQDALALVGATGAGLDALCRLADDLRRDTVGEDVTYVVNRNINFTNVCYTGCRFCAFAQRASDADAYTLSLAEVGERAVQAWEIGATEVCMQGGIHPDLPATAYFDLAAEVKRRAPGLHLHAFSPMEVANGAARTGLSISDWLVRARESGVDSIPGTAAEILDDEVRWVLTKGKLPAATWVEVVTTAHRLGIPSTATMMYGHVDAHRHWVAHLRLLARIQDDTGGFTEFVPLPFVHQNAPVYLAGLARPGPTGAENRAVHALARLLLHGRIRNIQCSWVKLGVDGPAGCRALLRGGVNDLGGTLMEETISRMAGSQHGSRKSITELEEIPAGIGRPARQRSTTYGQVSEERWHAARQPDGRRSLPVVG